MKCCGGCLNPQVIVFNIILVAALDLSDKGLKVRNVASLLNAM